MSHYLCEKCNDAAVLLFSASTFSQIKVKLLLLNFCQNIKNKAICTKIFHENGNIWKIFSIFAKIVGFPHYACYLSVCLFVGGCSFCFLSVSVSVSSYLLLVVQCRLPSAADC